MLASERLGCCGMETAPNKQTGPMLGAVEIDENQGTALRDTATGSTALEAVPPTWLGRSPLQAFTVGAPSGKTHDGFYSCRWAF